MQEPLAWSENLRLLSCLLQRDKQRNGYRPLFAIRPSYPQEFEEILLQKNSGAVYAGRGLCPVSAVYATAGAIRHPHCPLLEHSAQSASKRQTSNLRRQQNAYKTPSVIQQRSDPECCSGYRDFPVGSPESVALDPSRLIVALRQIGDNREQALSDLLDKSKPARCRVPG